MKSNQFFLKKGPFPLNEIIKVIGSNGYLSKNDNFKIIYKLDFTTETHDNDNDNGNENVTISITKHRNKWQTTIEGLSLDLVEEDSAKLLLKKLVVTALLFH